MITLFATFLYEPPEGGTQALPPLSRTSSCPRNGVDAWIVGVGLAALGFVLAAINLITTVRTTRAPGMAWRRMPVFSFASTVVSYLMLVAGPILLGGLVMLFFDRRFDGIFFETGEGGGPILYQHLTWIFLTAAYAAIVVFAAGVISEIVSVVLGASRSSRTARPSSRCAAIGVLGPLAWMQNMYTAPTWPAGSCTSRCSAALALAVPLGVLFFNWIGTLWNGALRLRAPMIFALGRDQHDELRPRRRVRQLGDPGRLAAREHDGRLAGHALRAIGGAVFGGFAALYYWFPKMTGRTMGEELGMARSPPSSSACT